jgi:hypothetical protein
VVFIRFSGDEGVQTLINLLLRFILYQWRLGYMGVLLYKFRNNPNTNFNNFALQGGQTNSALFGNYY